MLSKQRKIFKSERLYLLLIILSSLILFTVITSSCKGYNEVHVSDDYLEKGFINPPGTAQPQVFWWWLNSFINKEGVTRDLEEMKRKGIGGALIFDAAAVDRWRRNNVEDIPVGPAFMSPEWQNIFRHAVEEASRLGLELGVSMTSGFNAGGPWVTPEYGQQELVSSEMLLEGPAQFSGELPLPSGPVYDNSGKLLTYEEMEINNDIELNEKGQPVHYRDEVILAVSVTDSFKTNSDDKFLPDVPPGRLKNWALKSVHSFDYPKDKGFLFDVVYDNTHDMPGEPIIKSQSVYNITDKVDESGRLNWSVPNGKWRVLRFGHTHTGIRLQATNPKNKGLAMNHLSAEAASRQFEEIGKNMIDGIADIDNKSLRYLYLDSWEVRIANWTPGFLNEFRKRRGYDMIPYMPVLVGYIVENREVSNRFLHDYRETIGDCIADNYYGQFKNLCNQYGLEFHSEMATTPIPVDMLKCLGRSGVPVSEFWVETDLNVGRVEPWERMFGKQAASAAHIYGSKYASAEALTVIQKHWENGPFQLKGTIDQALCSGINKLLIHTFSHSPKNIGQPGYEYFAGTHFNPQITWWEQAHAFTKYIGRSQFLLQQGNFVADVCFYQGTQIPSFVPMKHEVPGLGPGYDYDVVNSEVILNRLSVSDGKIVLPDGMKYRLLVLPDKKMIDTDVLKKIGELINAGATVVGPKPDKTYGLENYPACDSLVKNITDSIWGKCDGEIIKEQQFGRGRIVWGKTPREILLDMDIQPDFEYKSQLEDTGLDYIHRSVSGAEGNIEIYFIANLKNRHENVELTFRVHGMIPEIWNPETGEISDVLVYDVNNGSTSLPLSLSPMESVFIVFRKTGKLTHVTNLRKDSKLIFPMEGKVEDIESGEIDILSEGVKRLVMQTENPGYYQLKTNDGENLEVNVAGIPQPITITDPWIIRFQLDRGAPDSAVFKSLISWTESNDPDIRYFSGTAEYSTNFYLDQKLINNETSTFLDLGNIREVAEISLNGYELGILWKPPFKLNITSAIKSGMNELVVRVTNLWPNRLIGDQYLPKEKRITRTNIGKFTKDSPLMESGLIGPVNIIFARKKLLNY